MLPYLLKRLLLMVPTLLLSVLLAFLLSEAAPTDPAESLLNADRGEGVQHFSREAREEAYRTLRQKFCLDRPVFYFSIASLSEPDTLYRVLSGTHRKTLARLTDRYGNWPAISAYYSSLQKLEDVTENLRLQNPYSDTFTNLSEKVFTLFSLYNPEQVKNSLEELSTKATGLPETLSSIHAVINAFSKVEKEQTSYKKYIPVIHWYGFHNRFNFWLVHLLKGNFGESFSERRPVAAILKESIPWTMLLNGIAILLAFAISIPLGISLAAKKNRFYDKGISTLLFVLYSLPVFWIATLLILFLGGGDYFNLFPVSGVSDLPADAPFYQKLPDVLWHLVLPVICLLYGSFAFISRQMRAAMRAALSQDYIRTAEAKGLGRKSIVYRHAFRNALLPMITLVAAVLPALVNGSVVVESIFSIPGMGQKSYAAVQAQDYPVIFAVLVIAAVLTMTGNLVADLLYAAADPRISFSNEDKHVTGGK